MLDKDACGRSYEQEVTRPSERAPLVGLSSRLLRRRARKCLTCEISKLSPFSFTSSIHFEGRGKGLPPGCRAGFACSDWIPRSRQRPEKWSSD